MTTQPRYDDSVTLRTCVLLVSLVSACLPAPRSGASSNKDRPEWHVRAEENQRAGESAYAARVAAAPRRAPGAEITVFLQVDAMDFFRKSIAHSNVQRDFNTAFTQYTATNSTPSIRVANQGGGVAEMPDWYQAMLSKRQQVDVYVMFTFRTVMKDESKAACPGVVNPLLILITARWSSAYLRKDHTVEETRHCVAGYPADLGESVPPMLELIKHVMAQLDTTVRGELPALESVLSLTPPYRATWPWRRGGGGGGGFDIF